MKTKMIPMLITLALSAPLVSQAHADDLEAIANAYSKGFDKGFEKGLASCPSVSSSASSATPSQEEKKIIHTYCTCKPDPAHLDSGKGTVTRHESWSDGSETTIDLGSYPLRGFFHSGKTCEDMAGDC